MDGETLTFRLAGINNQNFIMRDEQTGTWWQQINGEAILGPLKGRKLDPISWDEVTFAVWRGEHPQTTVLLPDEKSEEEYAEENWEEKILEAPTVTPVDPADALQPRDLIVGIVSGAASRAYPWSALGPDRPIVDTLEGTPLLIAIHTDGRSLRCFDRRPDTVDDEPLELYLLAGSDPSIFVDAGTGSLWDFTGLAIEGPLAGRSLPRISCLKDFWFDWKLYHPDTSVFADLPR